MRMSALPVIGEGPPAFLAVERVRNNNEKNVD